MQRHFPQYTKTLVANARKLRNEMTDAERKLWSLLRARQLGVKIRRQVPIGRYIADFLCEEKKLIIEVDGSQHFEAKGQARDKIRDEYLRKLGYHTVRFDNLDVLRFPDEVLMQIESSLNCAERIEVLNSKVGH
jgi:very-short-patch-repair endonuclease